MGEGGDSLRSDYQRIMLVSPNGGHPRALARTHSFVSVLAWSSRGVLAALEDRNRIVLYAPSGRQVGGFAVPTDATGVCGVAWSRDGTRLLLRTAGKNHAFWTTTPTGRSWRRLPLAPQAHAFSSCAVSWR